jgi:hypothetical protein
MVKGNEHRVIPRQKQKMSHPPYNRYQQPGVKVDKNEGYLVMNL